MKDSNPSIAEVLSAVNDLATSQEARFQRLEGRFDQVDKRFDAVDARLEAIERALWHGERFRLLEDRMIELAVKTGFPDLAVRIMPPPGEG